MIALVFAAPALAQSLPLRGDDPEYVRYLAQLDALDDLKAPERESPQIDMGMVNIVAVGSPAVLGEIYAAKMPGMFPPGEVHRTEHWFVSDDTLLDDPTRELRLVMVDETVGTRALAIDFLDDHHAGDWTVDPYLPIEFHYTQGPTLDQQQNLAYVGPQVERYPFVLLQGGVEVGAMLREWHLDGGGDLHHVVEHWLFYGDAEGVFSSLRDNGDEVTVAVDDTAAFVTTAGFFFAHHDRDWVAYAKPTYGLDLVGSDF